MVPFYMDVHVDIPIMRGLRRRGVDVLTRRGCADGAGGRDRHCHAAGDDMENQAKHYGTFDGAYYLAIWRGMFRAVLGWSEQQTDEWARRYPEFLSDANDIMFHETPVYWAALALIPGELRESLNRSELLELKNKIISTPHSDPDDANPETIDWGPFRQAVEQILAGYGCH